jgi:hypothetical protein
MDTERKSGLPKWVIPAAALVAVTTMGIGGWLSLRRLGPTITAANMASGNQPEQDPGDSIPVQDSPAAVHGRKSPRDYALPVFPSAFDFHSMEMGSQGGSAAFAVKQGTAAEICRYYIQQLGAGGWEYRWKSDTSASPGDSAHPISLKGTRVRWIDWKKRKQLTLLALNDPQKGRSAQAVLSWANVPGLSKLGAGGQGAGAGGKKP